MWGAKISMVLHAARHCFLFVEKIHQFLRSRHWHGEKRNVQGWLGLLSGAKVTIVFECSVHVEQHGNNRKFWFMNYFGQRTMQIKCTNLHFTVVSHIDSYLAEDEGKNENAHTASMFFCFFFSFLIYCVVSYLLFEKSTWNWQYFAPNLSDHNILCWLSVRIYSSHRRPPWVQCQCLRAVNC